MKTIVYCGGYWSTNIGNAFFNLGIMHALNKALPDANVIFIGDPPGWFWAHGRKPGVKKLLIDDLECDYIVISGPLFCSWLEPVWGDSLRRLSKKGTKILFLSAGSMEYSNDEFEQCRKLLEEIKPYMLISRDSETYQRYTPLVEHCYDGICFAFFTRDYFNEPLKIESKDIILCFDKGHDYDVLEVYREEINSFLKTNKWEKGNVLKKLQRSRRASKETEFFGYRIVRPFHVTNTRLRTKFKQSILGCGPSHKANAYLADIPSGYLYLYSHAKLTISERVHSCVPALAFGNSTWLISKTKRSRLFSRVGLDQITNRPVQADMEKLEVEKTKIIEFLKQTL